MSLSVNIAPRDLSKLATYVCKGVLELSTRSILPWSKWHQKYVVICKDNTSTLNLFLYENHLAEKAEAVYLVKEFERVQAFATKDNNIIGFSIKFVKPQIKPLVFSCDTEKSLEEWVEHIRDSIDEAKHTSTDSAYASAGSACRDSCRTSKPYFTIDEFEITEDIPKGNNSEEETWRKITETSSTTTMNQTDASKETKATQTGKKHGRNDAVKDHVVDKDETYVKAMISTPVQESKGKALPGHSGKFIVKERTHGLTTNPVQASNDENPEDPGYEIISNVHNPDTRTIEMDNLKPPMNNDSNSDHSGREVAPKGQGFSPTFESDIPHSAMLFFPQPQTSQIRMEGLDSQTTVTQSLSEKETSQSCSSSFASAREDRDKTSFQTDSQQTTFLNTEPVYSRPHKKSSKSGETGAINKNRNLPSSASSKSFSSVGSDASFKYESPEDTDQDERENIFKREDYFCPNRKQAIRQIEKSSVGTFLVCLNRDKCEVICSMTNLGPKGFKVYRREDGYSLFKPKTGIVLPTLDKLLAHYHFNDLPSTKYKVKLERAYKSK